MPHLLDLLNRGDPCSLVFLAVLLACIGKMMVAGFPQLQPWGWRAAGAAFVLYVGWSLATVDVPTTQDLIGITLRGLLAGALTLGTASTILAIGGFLYHFVILSPIRRLRDWRDVLAMRRALLARSDWDRTAYDRQAEEDARRQAEAEQAQRNAQEQRRRLDARAAAVRTHSLYAQKIGDRFSRQDLEDYLERFMGDDQPADDVERRERELMAILQCHVEEIERPGKPTSIAELAEWYQREKSVIESLDLDGRSKKTHLADLNQRYFELSSELMQTIEP